MPTDGSNEVLQHWSDRRSATTLDRAQSAYRDAYARDRARVIHSAGFRRLQAKTQVLGIGEGDFHRTRLTHSMEVAQIARGITEHLRRAAEAATRPCQAWLPDLDLIETIALCHDLGHPPFGHGGEIALNYALRDAGGFEGNGQTLRLLARLEAHTDGFGLDLTRRCMLGVLKYPVPYTKVVRRTAPPLPSKTAQLHRQEWKPPKCFLDTEVDVVDWLLAPFSPNDRDAFAELQALPSADRHGKSAHHALDTTIMELADDIAYGVHDFEDAISLKLLDRDDWDSAAADIDPSWGKGVDLGDPAAIGRALFNGTASDRKRAIGCLVNAFIVSIDMREHEGFDHPLLRHQAEMDARAATLLASLKGLIMRRVICSPQVQTLEYRGQQLVVNLADALNSDPSNLLRQDYRDVYEAASSDVERARVVGDYIAGMSDEYATRMYERLFVPRQGQFSDRL